MLRLKHEARSRTWKTRFRFTMSQRQITFEATERWRTWKPQRYPGHIFGFRLPIISERYQPIPKTPHSSWGSGWKWSATVQQSDLVCCRPRSGHPEKRLISYGINKSTFTFALSPSLLKGFCCMSALCVCTVALMERLRSASTYNVLHWSVFAVGSWISADNVW